MKTSVSESYRNVNAYCVLKNKTDCGIKIDKITRPLIVGCIQITRFTKTIVKLLYLYAEFYCYSNNTC